MTKKRILASALAIALVASSAFSLIAAENNDGDSAATSGVAIPTPAEEVVKPSVIEQTRIDDLLKEYGWDKLGLSFAKADYYSVFTDEDKAQIEKDAARLSMRGILDGTTMYVALANVKVKDAPYPYQLCVAVFSDLRTGIVNAAQIVAYPYPSYMEGAKIYAIDAKQASIDKAMGSYMSARLYQMPYEEHQAAAILGYSIPSKEAANIRSYFKAKGWNLGSRPVYQNPGALFADVEPAYGPFLNDTEVGSAMAASADGGPQVMMMMSGSGFNFVEKPYRFKGTDDVFYIAFCTFGGDATADDFHPTFSWLMMRPAVYNMDGSFDKFFYPVGTDLQSIVKDASDYFKTAGQSAPEGAVN